MPTASHGPIASTLVLAAAFLATGAWGVAEGEALDGTTGTAPAGSRGSWTVMPYFWAAGIDGSVAQFGVPAVDVDLSFSDIFDTIDFGAMLVAEWRSESLGIFTDLTYVETSDSAGTPLGILAADVGVSQDTLALTVAGEYRLRARERGHLDGMAGLRVWSVDTRMSFRGGVFDGTESDDGDTWLDPVLGLKGTFNATPRVALSGWAMAGGFGASSDFMWDIMGAISYEFSDTVSVGLGYRAFSVDFESGGFVYDIVQHGPTLGAAFRF